MGQRPRPLYVQMGLTETRQPQKSLTLDFLRMWQLHSFCYFLSCQNKERMYLLYWHMLSQFILSSPFSSRPQKPDEATCCRLHPDLSGMRNIHLLVVQRFSVSTVWLAALGSVCISFLKGILTPAGSGSNKKQIRELKDYKGKQSSWCIIPFSFRPLFIMAIRYIHCGQISCLTCWCHLMSVWLA